MNKIEKELFNRIYKNDYDCIKDNKGIIKIDQTIYSFVFDMKYYQLANFKGIGFLKMFKAQVHPLCKDLEIQKKAYDQCCTHLENRKILTKAKKVKAILLKAKAESGKLLEAVLHFKIGATGKEIKSWFEKEFSLDIFTLNPLKE